jgi:hypothetical protein
MYKSKMNDRINIILQYVLLTQPSARRSLNILVGGTQVYICVEQIKYEGRSNLNENSFVKNVFTTQWKSFTHYFPV